MANTRFVLTNMETPTKRLIQDWTGNAPLSLPLPPNSRKAGHSEGEETISAETLTQGGARGSCPSRGPGLLSFARTGLFEEAVASCHCTSQEMSNLQLSRRDTREYPVVTRQCVLPPKFPPEIRLNPGRGSRNPASLPGLQEIQANVNGPVTADLAR
jgi:hypothetical protein